MAGHKHLTEDEVRRIWMLHKRGLSSSDVAFVVGRNKQSCYRVIDIFEKCENGEYKAAEAAFGEKNQNLLAIARSYFGIVTEHKEEPKATEAPPAGDNTVKYLCAVLTELRRNNELLAKLVAAWEGK